VLLLAAEQAYAHAQLVQFPNHESAAAVLVPASVVLLILGTVLMVWGLLTETKSAPEVIGGSQHDESISADNRNNRTAPGVESGPSDSGRCGRLLAARMLSHREPASGKIDSISTATSST